MGEWGGRGGGGGVLKRTEGEFVFAVPLTGRTLHLVSHQKVSYFANDMRMFSKVKVLKVMLIFSMYVSHIYTF